MNERLQARVDKIEAEIARREAAKKSTSERQAEYVLRANRREEPAEDVAEERDVAERTWGDGDRERPELDGDSTSRRQAARITRGASRRGDS